MKTFLWIVIFVAVAILVWPVYWFNQDWTMKRLFVAEDWLNRVLPPEKREPY